MRDWLKAFRPASFRGVPFRVDIESVFGARRLSVSPIAYAETSVIEDMGRDPQRFSLDAYVAGDTADHAALALAAALERKGPGTLVLPMRGALPARVEGWSLERMKDRAGTVRFSIDFVEEGLAAVPFLPSFAAAALAGLMAQGAAIIADGLAAAISAGGRAAIAPNAATAALAPGRLAAVAGVAGLSADTTYLAAEAAFAEAGAAGDVEGAFAAGLVSAWRLAALSAVPRDIAPLIAAELPPADGTAVRAAERMTMAAALAVAVVRVDHAARRDARAAREAFAATVAPVLETAGAFSAEAWSWLASATGEAALALSRTGADRAPLVRVEIGVSLPSTVLAHRLYGDANRAAELVERNRVSTPVLMPTVLEALHP